MTKAGVPTRRATGSESCGNSGKGDIALFQNRLERSPKEVELNSKNQQGDFPGGTVVKNPPANAGDTGSSPGPGRSHMPRSN